MSRQSDAIDALARIPVERPATIATVIDWIEAELAMEDGNFRDVDEILADARTKFVATPRSVSSDTTLVPPGDRSRKH